MNNQTKGNDINDWEYREPTQADCVPDAEGNYPMVEVWDIDGMSKLERKLIAVLPYPCGNPFVAQYPHDTTACLWRHARIRKSYAERQAAWIERNGIKVGSRVKVTRSAESGEDGWGSVTCRAITEAVGTTCTVLSLRCGSSGIQLKNHICFPYFVLEPVTEPEYRKPTIHDVGCMVEFKDCYGCWFAGTLVGIYDGHFYAINGPGASRHTDARIQTN